MARKQFLKTYHIKDFPNDLQILPQFLNNISGLCEFLQNFSKGLSALIKSLKATGNEKEK